YNTADGATPPPIAFEADFPFGAIAPHWSGDAAPGAWVQAWFSADGETWSDAVSVGEDPDNGRPGRGNRRFGPLIAAPAGAQFVRYYTYDADGALTTLDGFTWTTIDASAGPSSETFAQQAAGPSVDRPPVISRADWGCDESLRLDGQGREIWPERYATVEHVVVHHSDTTNFEDPMAGIRSIYYYHTVTKGWGDIGYNYVVDFMGNVYEGRSGGENVVGGHALGYNVGSCGICAMGRFASVQITPEMRSGLTWIVAWASRNLDPLGAAEFVDIPKLPTIDGHRDVNPTTCPGDALYGDLNQLRQDVAAIRDGAAQAALPPAQFATGAAVVTTTDGGMLRLGPGSDFGLITPVPAGERLTVADGPTTNDDHVWYAVRGSSLGGWIVADVLAPDPGGATPTAPPDSAPPAADGAPQGG
ncbi:MAG TPA: N-acetylmuramoyl-L-alanine amidase, partial [Thermomicrobiales bacterium]|nr:N-acetylmuramoyl-L-alanine amidase [Thermomicrobiales bacterium]